MIVTLHNRHFNSLNLDFWQVAYLALEHYLSGPEEPCGPDYAVDFELEASSGREVLLRIWRDESGQIHIERLPGGSPAANDEIGPEQGGHFVQAV